MEQVGQGSSTCLLFGRLESFLDRIAILVCTVLAPMPARIRDWVDLTNLFALRSWLLCNTRPANLNVGPHQLFLQQRCSLALLPHSSHSVLCRVICMLDHVLALLTHFEICVWSSLCCPGTGLAVAACNARSTCSWLLCSVATRFSQP